jgi:hypothetical protein
MLGGYLVTTACRALKLRMEGSPSDTEGTCKYIEQPVVDSRQGVVLQLGCWVWGRQPHTVKSFIFTKYFQVPRTWTDFLVRPKHWKKDMRFVRRKVRSLYMVGAMKSVAGN